MMKDEWRMMKDEWRTDRQTNGHLWMWLKISLLATLFASVGPTGLGNNWKKMKLYFLPRVEYCTTSNCNVSKSNSKTLSFQIHSTQSSVDQDPSCIHFI